MKILKIVGGLLAAYVVVVVVFESLIGYLQPANEQTLALIVTNDEGEPHQRILSRIEHEGKLYVAVNHWPRAWFHTLQENPEISVAYNQTAAVGKAVVVTDETELASVSGARPLGLGFRILTGFPPRHFVRLDVAPAIPIEAGDPLESDQS